MVSSTGLDFEVQQVAEGQVNVGGEKKKDGEKERSSHIMIQTVFKHFFPLWWFKEEFFLFIFFLVEDSFLLQSHFIF